MSDKQIYELFLGVIVGAAGIVVPIIIYILQNKKKSLIFEEVYNIPLISDNSDLKDEIEIKYADNSVKNIFELKVRIKNNGTLSIKEKDIIAPIKITYKEAFLKCTLKEVNPSGIKVDKKINTDENSVECSFNLLNPLDYFTLQFVSLEKLSTPTIASRIDGLSNVNITSIDERKLPDRIKYYIMHANIFIYSPKFLLQFFKDMSYRRPLCFFFFPGLILASVSFLEGLKFLQNYNFKEQLSFVSTLLMVMLTIIGLLMTFTGTIISINKTMYSLFKR